MIDVPKTNTNTFIIYSKNPVIIGQSISVESYTGIESISGGLNNDNLSINPTVNDGIINWNVSIKTVGSSGKYSFICTIKTKGDETFASVESSFVFQVVLYGTATLYKPLHFYYKIGEEVEQTIAPQGVNGITNYGVQLGALRHGTEGEIYTYIEDNIEKTAFRGYQSGLYINGVYVDNVLTGIKLTGTPSRPGTYIFWINCYQRWQSNFNVGSNQIIPVFVSIYDGLCPENSIIVPVESSVKIDDARFTVFSNDNEHLEKIRFTPANGWSGYYDDVYYTTYGEEIITRYEYKLQLENDEWGLLKRVYTVGNTAPDFEKIDSCSRPIFDEVETLFPPVHGWSSVIFSGTSEKMFFIQGEGFYINLGNEVYQQVPVYNPQYEGLSMPQRLRYNSGNMVFFNEAQEKVFPQQSCIPFSRPDNLGVLVGGSIQKISDGDFSINGYPVNTGFFHDVQRFPYATGTNSIEDIPFKFKYKSQQKSYKKEYSAQVDFSLSDRYQESESSYTCSLDGTINKYQIADGELWGVFDFGESTPNIELNETYSSTWHKVEGVPYNNDQWMYETRTLEKDGNEAGFFNVILYPISGVKYKNKKPLHCTYTGANASFYGSCNTLNKTTYRWIWNGQQLQNTTNEQPGWEWTGSGSYTPTALKICGSKLEFPTVKNIFDRSLSLTRKCSLQDHDQTPIVQLNSFQYELTHTGTEEEFEGDIFSQSGSTSYTYIQDGETVETITINDPDLSFFNQKKSEIESRARFSTENDEGKALIVDDVVNYSESFTEGSFN